MPVTVRLVGDLRRFADAEAVEIAGPVCTLGSAMEELGRRYPTLGAQLLDDQGRLRYTTLLIVNGRSLTWPQDREVLIEPGGELLITRFVAGG
jgi:molybdopterin converting factor small subunit